MLKPFYRKRKVKSCKNKPFEQKCKTCQYKIAKKIVKDYEYNLSIQGY